MLITIGSLAPSVAFARSPIVQRAPERTVSGVVRDAQDAAVTGATATLTRSESGYAATVVTGPSGAFRFEHVPPGAYQLRVSAVGFAPASEDLFLDAGSRENVSVRLSAAGAQESVTVRAEPTETYAGGEVARGARVGLLGNQDLFDTPFNITSYTAQQIANTQAVSVSDVVKRDPAVRVANLGTTFYEDYQIRGFRVTGNSVLFDGLSATVPNYGQNLLYGTERVEVLNGANTLLSGLAGGLTVGGTINIVPKRAADQTLVEFEPIYESDSRLGGHLDLGHRFGDEKRFGVRLNVFGKTGDTAFDDEHERASQVALALDYRFDRARVFGDFGFEGQYTRGAASGLYADAGIPVPEPPPAGTNFVQPFTYSNVSTGYFVLRAEYDISHDVTVYGAFGGNKSKYNQLLSFGLLKNGTGDIDEIFQNGSGRDFTRTGEVGLRARFETGPISHQLAVSALRTVFGNDGFYVFDEASGGQPMVASNIYRPARVTPRPDLFFRSEDEWEPNNRNDLPSVAVADTMSFLDNRCFVTLGVRQQRIKNEGYSQDDGSFYGGYDKSALTPAFAGLVKVGSRVSLYGNYIESLQGGDTAPDEAVNRGQVFPPSRNRQVEGGVKVDFGRFGVTGAVYRFNQPIGILDRTTLIYSAAGKQRNAGAEVNVFGKLGASVRLNGGVAFTDAVLAETQDGLYEGQHVPGVARYNATLSGEWDTPFLRRFTLSGGVVRTDSVYVNFENTKSIDAVTALDFGARYETSIGEHPVTIRATVENPFNRAYWTADLYGGFFEAAPRVVRVSATFRLR